MTLMFTLLLTLAALVTASGVYHRYRPLPPGMGHSHPWRRASEVRFLADYPRPRQPLPCSSAIVPASLSLIRQARHHLRMDNFLFNADQGDQPQHLPLTDTVTSALRVRAREGVRIDLISDPINTLYGAHWPAHFVQLEQAGLTIRITDLRALRDSNPLWSALWRLSLAPFTNLAATGQAARGGWLPGPFGPHRMTLRSWLALPNFKANHRKTLVVDGRHGLVSSANLHDASSNHHNVGLRFSGPVCRDLLHSESAVMAFSGGDPRPPAPDPEPDSVQALPRLRLLTEAAIRDALLAVIQQARPGERLRLALFYLSHRRLIRALRQAHQRGVVVQLLLDPNRDAFGRQKSGMPNRPVASELHRAGIAVRWVRTHGEQFHSKLLLAEKPDHGDLLLGSANFTRRNLDNLNLESAVQWQAPPEDGAIRDASDWFDTLWKNRNGEWSLDYHQYRDHRCYRYWLYRLMEASGCCTF
ncbi:MAG: phospholipase D-like domain-containing protein [Oleiphilaceae bacterium]|nr:phospholipase D-like domain-containing protein [Oleiphilaceae bacterium]